MRVDAAFHLATNRNPVGLVQAHLEIFRIRETSSPDDLHNRRIRRRQFPQQQPFLLDATVSERFRQNETRRSAVHRNGRDPQDIIRPHALTGERRIEVQ